MTYDEIMREITTGLTGDADKDRDYLKEQMEKYKEHELATEIIRACGRLFYELIPEDKKDELTHVMDNDMNGIHAVLDEVRFNIYKKEYSKALDLISNLVEKTERNPMYQNDSVTEYFSFATPFEFFMYVQRFKSGKEIKWIEYPFSAIYLQYGSLLIDLKRYEEANQMLEKALRWNPMSAKIGYEYAETFKIMGMMDMYMEATRKAFSVAYTKEEVARGYRNFGYYFIEQEKYRAAIGCYLLSLQYDRESKNAQSELYYIHQKTNGEVKQPTIEELESIAKIEDFPIGVNSDVLGIAVSYGKHFLEQGQTEGARTMFEIVYDLTDDEAIKEVLDKLPNEEQKSFLKKQATVGYALEVWKGWS